MNPTPTTPTVTPEAGGHTPGPWFVCGDPGRESKNPYWREGRRIGSAPQGTWVADVADFRCESQSRADARLIAAAPDMLAALKAAQSALAMMIAPDAIKNTSVLHAFTNATEAEAKARAAIRLAQTGER